MRWTIHIPFRPLPWRGLLPVATCMLLHTAPLLRLIPARVFAPAGVVRCVVCVTHLRLRFDSMGDEEGYVLHFYK